MSRNRRLVRDLRERGYKAFHVWSPRGMIYCLRADLHVFDNFPKDTNYWLSRGATKLNLWSGVPLKVFERDIDNPDSRYYRLFHGHPVERALLSIMMPWHVTRPDLLIATSAETAEITSRAFAVRESQVCITGFPRNDEYQHPHLWLGTDVSAELDRFHAAVAGSDKVFLYLPTSRDNGEWSFGFDWIELDKRLEEMGAVLFVKSHPDDKVYRGNGFKNIVQLPKEIEIYTLLRQADALISDYSSVIFDFLLLDKPIIFYVPDFNQFAEGCRSFNFAPWDVEVGPICESFTSLLGALEQIAQGVPNIAEGRRAEILERLHERRDGDYSRRVLDLICQEIYPTAAMQRSSQLPDLQPHAVPLRSSGMQSRDALSDPDEVATNLEA